MLKPAGAAAVAPFGGEDDEIERVRALDLEPAAAAPARVVGRVERLHHHAFVAARQRVIVGSCRGVRGVDGERSARPSDGAMLGRATKRSWRPSTSERAVA